MKSFSNNHFIVELPKSIFVLLILAISILIHGDYSTTIQDSFKVFSTELVVDQNSSNDYFPSIFSIGKDSSYKSKSKSPFFQNPHRSQLEIQKKIFQITFLNVRKEILVFDKPTIIAQKRNPFNRSDLPDSIL